MPAARSFTWKLLKLPKATVEEVEDEGDISTHTFPAPKPTQPFCSLPRLAANFNDPRDTLDIPEAEDELLAASPSHDDDYPRPLAPRPFLEHMNEQATRVGTRHRAPNLGEAKAALVCPALFARGIAGTDIFGLDGVGYKDPDVNTFTQNCPMGIWAMLNFYVTLLEGGTYHQWGASARLAAHGLGRSKHCVGVLAALSWQFILTREVLDVNPYGDWNDSMLADEDLANDIRLHLQSLGK
ncbi:hypothetical protein C8R44DRAFT_868852 [Mycena epipterygia]|nr:hypothetical protein C8R44DRAFT_868852 [Mycena epipterygia]